MISERKDFLVGRALIGSKLDCVREPVNSGRRILIGRTISALPASSRRVMADDDGVPNDPFILLLRGLYQPLGKGPADNPGLTTVNRSDGSYSNTQICLSAAIQIPKSRLLKKAAMTKTCRIMGLVLIAALPVALAPAAARADDGIPFQGALAVSATVNANTQNTAYCGGSPHSLAAEAHGNGYTSLGAFTFSFVKTVDLPGPMHGCATLTAVNGDILTAIYDGTAGAPHGNGFAPATGTLTITGGTGKFQGAKGTLNFTVVFLAENPGPSFTGGPPAPLLYVSAFYTLQGNVMLHGD
jgi:hypothetical protein